MCINRPFDDQSQDRIRIEAEAIKLIFGQIKQKGVQWVGSSVLLFEINRTPNLEKKMKMISLTNYFSELVIIEQNDIERAKQFESMGLFPLDSLHITCAEKLKADVFLTTDDNLLKKIKKMGKSIIVNAINPIQWIEENTDD